MFKFLNQLKQGIIGTKVHSKKNSSSIKGSKIATLLALGFTAFIYLPQVRSQIQNIENVAQADPLQPIQAFEVTNQQEVNDENQTRSYFSYGVKMIPHIEKRHRGGEDAYYVDDQMLVVLDGVGGWNDSGVDPGLFSRQLASLISQEHKQYPEKSLKMCLVDSVQKTTFQGSSTAILCRIDQNEKDGAILKTTNLGDSGYVIFRVEQPKTSSDSQPVITKQFRSKEQQYRFNFPYQCGTNCDLPYKAFDNQHNLEDQDLVIVGSDGLFDNVYDEEMLTCIAPQLDVGSKKINNLLKVASCLANKAEEHGMDRRYFSPFAKGAKESGYRYMGGKLDDVTVVVGQFNAKKNGNSSSVSDTVSTQSTESRSEL